MNPILDAFRTATGQQRMEAIKELCQLYRGCIHKLVHEFQPKEKKDESRDKTE